MKHSAYKGKIAIPTIRFKNPNEEDIIEMSQFKTVVLNY